MTRLSSDPSSVASQATGSDLPLIADVAGRLLTYCRGHDWAGHDPYDALNSRWFSIFPVLDRKLPRLIATQALKRSPVNLRKVLLIPVSQNPKAIALFLKAALKLSRVGLWSSAEEDISHFVELLIKLRAESPYWCWGYSFPWQTRHQLVPRGAPNLVCTTFVGDALLDLHETRGDQRALEMALSAADYISRELYWTAEDGAAGFCYPLPGVRARVHNANFLAAELLARVSSLTGDERFVEPALKAARYSVGRQKPDGAWFYGELPTQRWIDNFHTGYNLCALRGLGEHLRTDEFDECLARGLRFYLEHFFRPDSAPRYFHDRDFPIDIHCIAQSLITLWELQSRMPSPRASCIGWERVPGWARQRSLPFAKAGKLASDVLRWTMKHLWDERGFFYYRVLRRTTIRTSYMRWSQAWMLVALATMAERSNEQKPGRAELVMANESEAPPR